MPPVVSGALKRRFNIWRAFRKSFPATRAGIPPIPPTKRCPAERPVTWKPSGSFTIRSKSHMKNSWIFFWQQFDPTDAGGSFVDRGSQYRSAIFYHNARQKKAAEASRYKLSQSGIFEKPIVTRILPASKFYPAEEYHQDFFEKNFDQYLRYRSGSGRDEFLEKIWGKKKTPSSSLNPSSREQLEQKLTPLQFRVTQ